jgi:hypothetical protein
MSVTMLAMESRSVPLSPSSTASKWQSMFLKPTQAGNVTLYQRKDATKFLSKFRSRSVSTFLSKTAAAFLLGDLLLFLCRNAKLCQGDIASLSRSRGQGWSLQMCQKRYVLLLVEDLEVGQEEVQVEQEDLEELVVLVDLEELVELVDWEAEVELELYMEVVEVVKLVWEDTLTIERMT